MNIRGKGGDGAKERTSNGRSVDVEAVGEIEITLV